LFPRARARARDDRGRERRDERCVRHACVRVRARLNVRARAGSVGERRKVKRASAAHHRGTSSRARARTKHARTGTA
jgi:hypothetical protein